MINMNSDGMTLWFLSVFVAAATGAALRDSPRCRTYVRDGRVHEDCSDLGLVQLPDGINFQAQVLDLSNNNFVTFPEELEQFTRLEDLDLSGNHLSDQPPTYMSSWTKLQVLNLSNNNYETWTGRDMSPSIKRLDLSKNKIITLREDAFEGLISLFHLDLSENRIEELPTGMFSETYNLYYLILARNYFVNMPEFQTNSLRSLDLSSCQIGVLNVNTLSRMTSLLEIDLSMNQLEYVPDYFSSNTLQELNLSYNRITSISDRTFSSLPHLAVLDLRGNEFKDVWSTGTFSSNPFLREILLKGNRWSCDGFGVNLLLSYEFLTKDPAKVGDRGSLICYSPANVTHLTWQEAYIQTWHRSEQTQTFTLIAVLVGIIIGVLVTSLVCRGLMSFNSPQSHTSSAEVLRSGSVENGLSPRAESIVLRIPIGEDLPPSYDEALLMPRLNSSFHSLPDFIDEDETGDRGRFRRSRSIGDLMDRPRGGDRRSVRTHRRVEINIE